MLKRRRPFEKWSFRDVANSIVGCITSDPDYRYVRAAYIMELRLDRLPKDFEEKLLRDAEEAGYDFDGVQPFTVFCLDFDDADRTDVFMDFNYPVLVRHGEPAPSIEAARAAAEAWVTDDGRKLGPWVDFDFTPGIYQTALLEMITGREVEEADWSIIWALPSTDEHVIVRRYPPRVTEEPLPYDAPLDLDPPEDPNVLGDGYVVFPVPVFRRMLADKF